MNKYRKSNFEILRIIAIFMIVSFHCSFHSGFTYEEFSANVFLIKSFYLYGELGVNLFFLLTGYFQINRKVKPRKIVILYAELLFYIIVSIIIKALITNDFSFNYLKLIKSFFIPEYWFFSAYILIYVFSPFLNILIKNLSKNHVSGFLFVCYVIFSFLPTVIGLFDGGGTEGYYFFNRFIWGCIIYCTGAFISLYNETTWNNGKKNIILAVASYLVMLVFIILFGKVRFFSTIGLTEPAFFWQTNTIPMLILSVSVFNLFRLWKMNKTITIINTIASTTLGIYLLSDGQLRTIIWDYLFNSKEKFNYSALFSLIYIAVASIIIIIFGVIIDLFRQTIYKFTIVKWLERIDFSKMKKKVNLLVNRIFN